MRRYLVAVVAALSAGFPAAAHSLVIHLPEDPTAEAASRELLAHVAGRVPVPGGEVHVRDRPCSDGSASAACVRHGRGWRIMDYDGTGALVDGRLPPDDQFHAKLIFLHEVGHLLDIEEGRSRAYRAGFLRLFRSVQPRGMIPERWYAAILGLPLAPSAAEWFANAYAICALWSERPHATMVSLTAYNYRMSEAQTAKACGMLRRLPSR